MNTVSGSGMSGSIYSGILNFATNNTIIMPKNTKKPDTLTEDFEMLQLKKRIAALESQLKDAEMKVSKEALPVISFGLNKAFDTELF